MDLAPMENGKREIGKAEIGIARRAEGEPNLVVQGITTDEDSLVNPKVNASGTSRQGSRNPEGKPSNAVSDWVFM